MRLIGALREAAFFVALLIVGTLFVAVSRDGLLTRSGLARDRVLVRSFLLLGLIALALIWSFFWLGNEVVAAVIPATILFLAQSLLSASKDD